MKCELRRFKAKPEKWNNHKTEFIGQVWLDDGGKIENFSIQNRLEFSSIEKDFREMVLWLNTEVDLLDAREVLDYDAMILAKIGK